MPFHQEQRRKFTGGLFGDVQRLGQTVRSARNRLAGTAPPAPASRPQAAPVPTQDPTAPTAAPSGIAPGALQNIQAAQEGMAPSLRGVTESGMPTSAEEGLAQIERILASIRRRGMVR